MHDKYAEKSIAGKTFDGCVFEDYPFGHNLGGAGLISTLSDYSRFAIMLLNEGKTEYKQIVAKKTIKLLSHPYIKKEVFAGNYN